MKKFLLLICLGAAGAQPEEIITGYLRYVEVSDCMDACSQYNIESESPGQASVDIIFSDDIPDLDLYIDRFVEVSLGQEVLCVECTAFEVEYIALSDDCVMPVFCFFDPCDEAYDCALNIPAECVSNYCGGCNADFYDLDGNLVDCFPPAEECTDLADVYFGPWQMELGFAVVAGECVFLSGGGWEINGVDYSDAFFDSFAECEETCMSNCASGDINEDGDINVVDIVEIANIVLNLTDPTGHELCSGDMNEDGHLNVLDIVAIVQIILNPGDDLPEECFIIPEVGPCDGICPTYFYNPAVNACEEFITGCCGVEAFETMEECENVCE